MTQLVLNHLYKFGKYLVGPEANKDLVHSCYIELLNFQPKDQKHYLSVFKLRMRNRVDNFYKSDLESLENSLATSSNIFEKIYIKELYNKLSKWGFKQQNAFAHMIHYNEYGESVEAAKELNITLNNYKQRRLEIRKLLESEFS